MFDTSLYIYICVKHFGMANNILNKFNHSLISQLLSHIMYILQLTSQKSSPPFQFFCLVPLLGSGCTQTPIELMVPPIVSVALQPSSGPGCLITEVPKSHTDTSTHACTHTHASTHAVGILRSSDQLVTEAATYITHNKLTDEYPCS